MTEEWTPKQRFELMEKHGQAMKGKYWHPIDGPHCICGVLDCPSPIFCNCNERAREIAIRMIHRAIINVASPRESANVDLENNK